MANPLSALTDYFFIIDEYKLDAFKIKRKSKHSHMNKKLMYIFAIFIVAAITCISQPKKTTLRDKAMVNYVFDYLSSPGSLPTVNHWIIHRRDTGMSNQRNRKIHARKVNWGGSTSKVWGSNPTPVKQFSGIRKQLNKGMLMLNIL